MSQVKSPLSEEQALDILRQIVILTEKRKAFQQVKDDVDQRIHMVMVETAELQAKLKPNVEAAVGQ